MRCRVLASPVPPRAAVRRAPHASLLDLSARIAALAGCLCAAGATRADSAPRGDARQAVVRSLDAGGGAIFVWNDAAGRLLAQRVDGGGVARWPRAGVPLSTVTAGMSNAAIADDGAGGVIVAWLDARSGQARVYAQRLDGAGVAKWATEGVAVNAAASGAPDVTPDGSGGAFVAWTDTRGATASDVYVQHLSAGGAPTWTTNGIPLAVTSGAETGPRVLADGAGGAIVAWTSAPLVPRTVLAQRVDGSGALQWAAGGLPVLDAAGLMQVATDGAGGIVASCVGDTGVRFVAQRVTASGQTPWGASGVVFAQFELFTTWGLFPAIVPDGAGGAIVAWYGGTQALGDRNLYAQRLDPAGVGQWGATGRLVAPVSETGQLPVIAPDGSGGVFLAWSVNTDVLAQRLDPGGTALWSASGVPVCTASDLQAPLALVADGAGGAIAGWLDRRNGGAGNDVYAQRLAAGGAAQWRANGAPVFLQRIGQRDPAIVADGAGGAWAAWMEEVDGIYQIRAQHRDSAGEPGGAAQVLCGVDSRKGRPFAVPDGAGGIVVAWSDTRSGVQTDLYAQRVDAGGAALWTADGLAIAAACDLLSGSALAPDGAGGAFVASAGQAVRVRHVTGAGSLAWGLDGVVAGAAPPSVYRGHSAPCVTTDGAGGAIVAWVDSRSYVNHCISGCGTAIYAQRVDASGTALWTANGVLLRSPIKDAYGSPEIASDGAGGAFVAWDDERGAGVDVYGQHLAADGSLAWIADGQSLCASTTASHPSLVATASGQAILAWTDSRSAGGLDVYAQRVSFPGPGAWATSGVALCAAAGDQSGPVLAADGAGGAVAAWTDTRADAAFDVYAQRIDASGALLWDADGLAVSTGPEAQALPAIASAPDGGAIFAWQDSRLGFAPVIGFQRLGPDGSSMWVGEPVGVDPPGAAAAFTLAGIRPNPAARDFTVAFSLPDAGSARLEVLDVSGRRLASLDVGGRPGPQRVRVQPEAGRPGLYLVRIVHARGTRVAKVAVVR